jgi:anaerobic selenocysteine-containing dehydrogenase
MTGRRATNGVLHNFLATYTRRYSDFDGYWLFALLVDNLDEWGLNLLEPGTAAPHRTPLTAASDYAVAKFADQVQEAGLSLSCIRQATRRITKSPNARRGWAGSSYRS